MNRHWAVRSLSARLIATCLAPLLLLAGCVATPPSDLPFDPPEQTIGERLFLETRFAQYFAEHMTDVNSPLGAGDPVVSVVQNSITGPMPGPFAGESINCRSCHFVDEFQKTPNAGNRTYADFTDHSPIPRLLNGFTNTPRNAMQMVGSLQPHTGFTFLHFDGEFADPEDLVRTTLTGRNFGWAADEAPQALAHIATVIRQDNGQGKLAANYARLSYADTFLGTDKVPLEFRIPAKFRLNVSSASDQQILDAVAALIAEYMKSLLFQQDDAKEFNGSPFDIFVWKNGLPRKPNTGESDVQYTQRLSQAVQALSHPRFITPSDGKFLFHYQPFAFGATELQGLQIFLSAGAGGGASQHAGNCVACHVPPNFTDFRFHNTGVSQAEYDAVNGSGAFMALAIPSLAARNANFNLYMPASANHPNASESFRHHAVAGSPQFADLGLWNVYLNPDIPNPQSNLMSLICANAQNCPTDQGLPTTIAQFKTPTLRDLVDSAPYFHNGSNSKFTDVINFYIQSSQLAHQGLLRNPPPEFQNMSITQEDAAALTAFLKSLTEDYH